MMLLSGKNCGILMERSRGMLLLGKNSSRLMQRSRVIRLPGKYFRVNTDVNIDAENG